MIDFTRAFDSAWERMMVILFRPFDLGKWCVIGFSAFLAGLLSGGNGGNGFNPSSYRQNFNPSANFTTPEVQLHQFQTNLSPYFVGIQTGLIILMAGAIFIFILAFIALLYWLGARGQFLFLDNIVRNRGAIAWPWSYYARRANQVFVFYLIFMAITFGMVLVLVVPIVLLSIPLIQHSQWPQGGALFALVTLALVYLAAITVLSCLLFIFREWGVALMFRNGLTARAAFGETMELWRRHPGSLVLFILLRIALWIALFIVSILACCFTCCLAILPYIGTIVLLPALIYIRCFSLDCLAQFGPARDVWTVDVPPVETSLNPPPPPG
jgi:hypothetical protein